MVEDLASVVDTLRRIKPELSRRYPIKSLGVFGSFVRGEQRPDSDVDVLVEFDGPMTLFRYVELEEELASALGQRVDLVSKPGLKPFIGRRILSEVVSI